MDKRKVCPITFQGWPPLSKMFLLTFCQKIWVRNRNSCRKPSTCCTRMLSLKNPIGQSDKQASHHLKGQKLPPDWLELALVPVSPLACGPQVVGAIIFQPINRVLPLRCLEEKYGLSNNQRDRLMAHERRSQKRLSLNITNGHSHDSAHGVLDAMHCLDNGMGRGSQLKWVQKPSAPPHWLKWRVFYFLKLGKNDV